MNQISSLAPTAIWKNFQKLCDTPRPSKKEEAVLRVLEAMADNKGLPHFRDAGRNLVISVPATPGYENRKIAVLQAHVDMVTQANAGTSHDFDKDPIRMVLKDEWITADNTTLGADNGIGAAAMMAFMTEDNLEHGPLTLLFTVDEEQGLTGAINLEAGKIEGDILLNLDTEEEHELCVGCAGGGDLVATFSYELQSVPTGYAALNIALTGLKGGHSGIEIGLGHGNANKLMARLLRFAIRDHDAQIVKISAGTARNAIPRESFVTIILPQNDITGFRKTLAGFEDDIRGEIAPVEPNFAITATDTDMPVTAMSKSDSAKFNNACLGAPNGVQAMSTSVEGVVETSINLAIIDVADGTAKVKTSARSSINSARDAMRETATAVFENIGATVEWGDAYPGWKPDAHSEAVELMKSVHNKLYGFDPEIKVIHAGLECGVIGSKYPAWDMVSFGPTIRRAHSPEECVHVPSVSRFWDYLLVALKEIPAK